MMRAKLYRVAAILWTAIILLMSGESASAGHSGMWLREFFSALADDQFFILHFAIRKLAHVVAYGVLGLLYFSAIRGSRVGWRRHWSLIAVAVAILVALIDEGRQAFTLSRTGAISDVLLDSVSAAGAQFFIWRRSRSADAIVRSDEVFPDSPARRAARR